MSKKLNKTIAGLLSGVIMSSVAITPMQVSAVEEENLSNEQLLVNSRAIKTGTVSATTLNVRKGAGTSYSKLGSLSKGATVQIESTTSNGWHKIKYRNGYGYVSGDYITNIKTTETNTSASTTVIYTGNVNATSLNVRSGGSTSYSVVGKLSRGTKIQITAKLNNGWHKIKYGSGYGYVSGKYVNNVVSANSSSSNATSNSTKVIYTGTTTDVLNVRSGGSTSYSVIGKLSKGTKVEITAKLSNGWHKIKHGSGYGYVSGKYVNNVVSVGNSSVGNTSSATTVKYSATVNTDSLNVRNGGSTSYSVIGKLSRNTKVEIVDKMSNGWSKIKYSGGFGYVNTSYLANITSSSSSGTTVIKTGVVNTNSLNVRSGNSTSYSIIGKLTRNTKVEVVKVESNGWYKIKYNGGYGYVSSTYVNVAGERNNLNNFLFVGDSFTVLMKNTIQSKNSNTYIHAKSGSRPGYWLDKVSSMPSNSNVDGVVLLIGVNGAGYESNKTDAKALINKLSARYPNKTIYVQKVFPVGRAFTSANPYSFNQKIAGLNSVIKSHCNTVSNAKFIDTTSGFVDSNGYLIHHNGDGLHIASSYNNQFYNNIFNAVKNAEK